MLWNLLCCFGSLLVLSEERLFKYDFFLFLMPFIIYQTLMQCFEYCRTNRYSVLAWSLWKSKKKKYLVNIWHSLEIETGMCVYSRSWWTQKLWGCHPGWIPISAWWFNSMEGGVWKKSFCSHARQSKQAFTMERIPQSAHFTVIADASGCSSLYGFMQEHTFSPAHCYPHKINLTILW